MYNSRKLQLKRSLQWRILKFQDLFLKRILKFPKVLSPIETIDYIIKNDLSLSRFGDGEIGVAYGQDLHFQKFNYILAAHLKEILKNNNPNLLVCIPDCFGKTVNSLCEVDKSFWKTHLMFFRTKWHNSLNHHSIYGNTWVSRIYSMEWNKEKGMSLFNHLEKLWENKDIVIIEGKFSRLGVGNNCFEKAKSIQRILGPAENAFNKYDKILEAALKVDGNPLFILALGPTATLLASDLSKAGKKAYDLGHLDIEYEWMDKNVKSKVPIMGKYVNEALISGESKTEITGSLPSGSIEVYQSQIISTII